MKVYNQIDLIPAGTARRDALRLTKKKAKSLPRVTAYATAECVLEIIKILTLEISHNRTSQVLTGFLSS